MGQSFLLEHGSGIRRQYLRNVRQPDGVRAISLEGALEQVRGDAVAVPA
jgi:hypothetical protein